MADRIKGITIELNGDTTKLSKALDGVNKEVKSTQVALKDVDKLLKLDPKNTELLKQKQKLLADQIGNTKEKLEQLKSAQANMEASGVDKNSAQYMNLRREIIDCENSLNGLEKAAASSNAAMQKVAAVSKEIGDGAQKVADKTKALSAAAGGLLAGLGAAAYGAVTAADDLNTLAKQSGFTTEELQKMQYAADRVDVSMEDITGAAKKMKTAMASGKDAFSKLGVETKNADGSMRDVNTVFWETVQALSQVQNETERDQIAMELFGKSADSLAGIIDDGGAAFRELGDEAERAGLIMGQDTLDSLNEVNDSIDKVKATAKGTLAQTGAKALEAVLPALNSIVDAISKLLSWIGSLDKSQVKLLLTIVAVVAAISPVASIITGIASAISTILPLLSVIGAFFAANPVVIGIMAIVAVMAALVTVVVKNWSSIKKHILDTAQSVTKRWQELANTFRAFGSAIAGYFSNAFSSIRNLGASAANAVTSAFSSAISWVNNAVNSVMSAVNSVRNAVSKVFGGSTATTTTTKKVGTMASGGTLRHGMSLVGENGPELLTVGGGQAVVQPLNVSVDSGSLASALGGSVGAATNVNVSFTGSLAQLAAVLQPVIQVESVRRGGSFVRA